MIFLKKSTKTLDNRKKIVYNTVYQKQERLKAELPFDKKRGKRISGGTWDNHTRSPKKL